MKRIGKILGMIIIVALLVGGVPFMAQPAQATETGSISGHVLDSATGDPIPDLHVNAEDYSTGEWMAGDNTDSDGNYVLSGLPTGDYRVRACSSCSGMSYIDEYYDGTYRRDEATPVHVEVPGETNGINFSLELGGTISGRVTATATGNPIPDLHVNAEDYSTGEWMAGNDTDSEGNYVLILPTGDYRVRACSSCSGMNYIDEWYDGAYRRDEATPVHVEVPGETSGINFSLEVGGSISGRVTDSATGNPIPDLHVIPEDYSTGEGMAGTNTDSDGNYVLILPTGDYRVMACSSCSGMNYIDEWYDGTYRRDEATPVHVEVPGETSGINFTLEVGGTISGRVVDSITGDPVIGARVEVIVYESLTGYHLHYGDGETNADGYYTTSALPTGEYGVRVRADGYVTEWYLDTCNQNEATPVSVTAPDDTPNINFSLEVGGSISGRVTDSATGDPIPDLHVNAEDYSTGEGMAGNNTDSDGNYVLSGLPTGDYRVRACSSCSGMNYIDEYYDGTYRRDEATPVHVEVPGETSGINFSLEVGGCILGHVYQSNGTTPIVGARVEVFDYESLSGERVDYGGAETGADGSYQTGGLPTGTYGVRAKKEGYAAEWYQDVYSESQATPVEVTAGQDTGGKDFTLEALMPRETIEEAIADGIAWLAAQQNPDGSWGTQYRLAKTALAVLKFESYATDLGLSPFDEAYPHKAQVEAGLDYIFANAYIADISKQSAGIPDTNSNGIGVYFHSPGDTKHVIYETSIALMAIAASTTPSRVVDVAGSPVNGWTYEEVLQDAVDYMAWAQTDYGSGRGGWDYEPKNNAGWRSDQSNSGWATLGLAYAEASLPTGFEITIPEFVKAELNIWIDYIQDDVDGDDDDGGSWYTGPDDPDPDQPVINIIKTGNLLQQMAWVGDTKVTPRVVDAVNYLVRHWDENADPGWRGWPGDATCYGTTYATMKGLSALDIDAIDSIDWFQDFVDAILGEQAADGWWLSSRWDTGDRILSTEWALLTLERVVLPFEVVIDIKPDSFPNSINLNSQGVIPVAILTTSTSVGEPLTFDATTVDAQTVRFGPAQVAPVQYALEDVDKDGDKDLILHFGTQETGIKLGDTSATLTGKTVNGRKFFGIDSVRTLIEPLPKTPTNLAATAISSYRIDLNWKDNSDNETCFKIERKTGAGGTWGQIATVEANVTSYSNTGLTPNTTYYYRVRAYSGVSDSRYSNEAYATTLPPVISLGEAVDNTALSWTTTGDANWFGQAITYYYGGGAAQSGAITHNQSTYLRTTVTGPGTLTFYWKVSSESGWDFLRFHVDGIERTRISGSVDWQQKGYSIGSGTHNLEWRYTKDSSVNSGSDCGWVDKVEFTLAPAGQTAADLPELADLVARGQVRGDLLWNPFEDLLVKPDGTPFKVAYTVSTTEVDTVAQAIWMIEDWFVRMGLGEKGDNWTTFGAGFNLEAQISWFEDTAATMNPDWFMCHSVDADLEVPVVERMVYELGIPVFTLDCGVNTDAVTSFIAHKFEGPGGTDILAEWLVDALQAKGYGPGNPVTVLELWGMREMHTAQLRHQGFHSVVDGIDWITVIESPDTYWAEDQTAYITADMVMLHPEIKAIWHHGCGAGGIVPGLESIGMLFPIEHPNHIIVASNDTEIVMWDQIIDGWADACSTHAMAEPTDIGFQVAVTNVVLGQPVDSFYQCPYVMVTRDNIDTVQIGGVPPYPGWPRDRWDLWLPMDPLEPYGFPQPSLELRMLYMGY